MKIGKCLVTTFCGASLGSRACRGERKGGHYGIRKLANNALRNAWI